MRRMKNQKMTSDIKKPSLLLRLRDKMGGKVEEPELRGIPVLAANIKCLQTPVAYQQTLLAEIKKAQTRILLAALYLQDDAAGKAVLNALYAAKKERPNLEITVFVDWHRAQRGLIGQAKIEGNSAFYKATKKLQGEGVNILGVPVQKREFLGVFHLKGFVIDDKVIYSGASINEVYLHFKNRYRIDRYHLIENATLANTLADFLQDDLQNSGAVFPIDVDNIPKTAAISKEIHLFRKQLHHAEYGFLNPQNTQTQPAENEVLITPLVGCGFGKGLRKNALNQAIMALIASAKQELVLFTPYFNPPGAILRALDKRLKEGCRVMIVIGDKTANDFYLSPSEDFKTIGALPYLYEANLRRFCQKQQKWMENAQLNIHLWREGENTFHLKGLLVDEKTSLLTGHNINPRAWRLDLENGLLVSDPHGLLVKTHQAELAQILQNTTRLNSFNELETLENYPEPVQKLLRRLARVKADRLVNQIM